MFGTQYLHRVGQEAVLQHKYIELLESRIKQLEGVISESAAKNGEDEDDKAVDSSNTDETTSSGRYVVALREWDRATASYKDKNVVDTSEKKKDTAGIAYIFRRVVYMLWNGEKSVYTEIEVKDPQLVQLLKTQIDSKYPGINLDGSEIYMQTPFPAIIHNWDKLQQRAKQDPDSQPSKDLSHLLSRVENDDELVDYFKTRESNLGSKVTTFETLWTIFPPKTLVVAKPYNGMPQLLQVQNPPFAPNKSEARNLQKCSLTAWNWDWNGKRMVKVHYGLQFKRFRGTKPINELDYYPLSYHSDPTLCDEIRKRSKIYLFATKFCTPGAGQKKVYDGLAYTTNRSIVSSEKDNEQDEKFTADEDDEDDAENSKLVPINGEIISDAQAYLQYAHNRTQSYALGKWDDWYIEVPVSEIEDVFMNLKAEDIKNGVDKTNDNFLIVPPRILGYSTREKLWGQFNVAETKDPPKPNKDSFRTSLQLDQEYKNLIEALVFSHEQRSGNQIEDVVSDKGKGLVLLLHGPPGVGKTLTAETIAEATGKPLFVVSVAEIGLKAELAERNLGKMFKLATKWEAILLVDEADVFLETRGATSETSRNALVSVLLRVLEYYQGIIILTTNRIKSIDVAVISRIHLAIRYVNLTADQMKAIFKYFLDKLRSEDIEERGSINQFIDTYGHMYKLNGRQIRNVVSSALASARHDKSPGSSRGGKLTAEHLRKVCEMTKDFQNQLEAEAMLQRANNEVMK